MKEILKMLLLKVICPFFYQLAAVRKLRPCVLFVEVRSNHLTDSFRLLDQELERRGIAREYCFLDNLHMSMGQQVKGTLKMLWKAAVCPVIFVNDSASFLGAFSLRKGSRMVQVWHACGAFKRWGYSVADRGYGGDRKHMDRYPYHRNYSLVPVSGEDVVFAYVEAFGMEDRKERVKPLGCSRTDIFFQEEFIQTARKKLDSVMPGRGHRKVILYAPTFRGQAASAVSPTVLNPTRWKRELGEDYVLLMKHHPFVKVRPEIPEECSDFAMDVTDSMTIEELLCVADLCITDYSSLIFEYSLQNKPMIFWAYDREDYEDFRGFYFPYEEFVPGPIVETEDQVLEAIGQAEHGDMEVVRRFRERFMGACDGHSTERILDELGLKGVD